MTNLRAWYWATGFLIATVVALLTVMGVAAWNLLLMIGVVT